ncbi:MAG: 1,4-alpha-glucan branching enzyme [Pseudomonadota bacterium]|jgi:1,4-alpha-glucan branching enzyme
MPKMTLKAELEKLALAQHHNPYEILGKSKTTKQTVVRAFLPNVQAVEIVEGNLALKRLPDSDFFEWRGTKKIPDHYQLRWTDSEGNVQQRFDPYTFSPTLSDFDLHLFSEGKHRHAYRFMGAHLIEIDGISGVRFAVWSPNAERVSVVGNFNQWDGRCHPMHVHANGVWELFIPNLGAGVEYKFEIRQRETGLLSLKSDPYGQHFEMRPANASITIAPSEHAWTDQEWLEKRSQRDWLHAPMSVYEVHLGSWQRAENGEFLNYRELAYRLVKYVKEMGFSYIELLPITEHPYDGSWGYQTTGYFAPTSRFGTPDDFRFFVDYCHKHDIGVILDWVPAHFPKDAHGLARFDGTALYEHEDPRKGEHLDWSTLIYNFGRNEVRTFLISSAIYWLEEFHLDGLRVDAVASMLYLDYSRTDWIPNQYGGRENLEAIDFLRELNAVAHGQFQGAVIIAEESTAWPQVTRPTWLGGLGFSMKWNMGWMNDMLSYISCEPIYRQFHHDWLTFSMLYAFNENFMLPFSHDEVVHGKSSMLHKMPGDEWQKFANLRLLYSYLFTHPGKKLLFMGTEFAQGNEWDAQNELDWFVLDYNYHRGVQQLVKDLNKLYHELPALHHFEFEWQGFSWIDCHDAQQSILTFLRQSVDDFVVVVVNFTPVVREHYRIGVPKAGDYQEIFNSDSVYYGGSNVGNGGGLIAQPHAWMNQPCSLELTLPPLGAIILRAGSK